MHVPVSVRQCMIDYLIEMTCIYVFALLSFYKVKSYMLVYYRVNYCKGYGLWCTVREMRLMKCSIIAIISY